MAHGQVRKKAVHYEVGYFRDDGERSPALEPSYPDEPLPADARQPALAFRGRVAPFHLAGNKGLLKTLTAGAAWVSTDVPEGPDHLQGQSASGYHFFPRRYLTSGRRLRTGVEFVWTPGPAGVSAEYLVRGRHESVSASERPSSWTRRCRTWSVEVGTCPERGC